MPPKKAPKAPKNDPDPEVEQARQNLGLPSTAEAEAQAEAARKAAEPTLEELNGNAAPEAPKPHRTRRDITKRIHTQLEGEAREEATTLLIQQLDEVKRSEDSKKAVNAEWTGIVKKAKSMADETMAKLRDGVDELVDCEEVKDYDKHVVQVVRKDNGEVLEERPMDERDRQPDLGLEGESPASAAPTPPAVDEVREVEFSLQDGLVTATFSGASPDDQDWAVGTGDTEEEAKADLLAKSKKS